MKFIKSLICNCLCINNLNNLIDVPRQYYGIKKIKKIYYDNNIYYDVYQDDIHLISKTITNLKYKKYKKYNSLTAEHIFPQSYTKLHKKAKFDMHNIFLTQSLLNSNRSNYKFSDENKELIDDLYLLDYNNLLDYNKNLEYNHLLNYKNNKKKIFVPYTNSRGLIARSIAYMDLTYENIDIKNVIDIDTLLKWNFEYPPSLLEKEQNKIIKNYQGNFNIFINNYNLITKHIYNNYYN